MPWQSLGLVTVGEEWRSFPLEAFNTETFRLLHTTIVDPSINSCWLKQYFPIPDGSGELRPWRRIYPSVEPTIITLPIPKEFLEQGYFVRSLFVQWRKPYFPTPWQLEIQAFY